MSEIWAEYAHDSSRDGTRSSASDVSSEVWSYNPGQGLMQPPVVTADGTIVAQANDESFYVLNPDGTLRVNFFGSYSNQKFLVHENKIFIAYKSSGGFDGAVECYDLDGHLQWTHLSTPDFLANVGLCVGNDGFIYHLVSDFDTGHDEIFALDPSDGSVHHSWDANPSGSFGNVHGSFPQSFTMKNGFVYLGAGGSSPGISMVKYDQSDGTQTWVSTGDTYTPAQSGSEVYCPTVVDGKVFFLAATGPSVGYYLICLNDADGSFLWSYYDTNHRIAPYNGIDGVPVADGKAILSCNGSGTGRTDIIAVDISDGSEAWRYSADVAESLGGTQPEFPAIGNDGFVLCCRYSVLRIKMADGTLDSSIMAGETPLGPALAST